MSNNPSYKEDFINSLGLMKVGLISFFVIVTIVYQANFHSIEQANTFFGEKSTRWRVILDSIITGLLGVLTVVLVVGFRVGFDQVIYHWRACLIVFTLLSLFNLSQESSGLNRYMSKNDTAKGEGPYAEIDGTTTPEGREKFKNATKQGEYFITSMAYTCAIFLGILILYLIFKMFRSSFSGWLSGNHNIPSYSIFLFELILVVCLNGLAPLISTKVRGEKYTRTSTEVILFICIVSFILHFMFQYTGLYDFQKI
jgi:hypothetical protein